MDANDDSKPPVASVPQQPFPSWKQALVIMGGGIVLAATACVGFLASFGGNFERGGDTVFTPLAAILFVAGLLAAFVGFILVVIRMFRGSGHKK